VFGYVGGGALPFDPKTPGSDFILAFQALPVVLVMSVLSSLLFYWRILPLIVRGFSWAGAHARGRRRGRPVDRSQYLCRPGRGAAVHPALSRQAVAQ
jgi:nucleoside permease NupC